MKKLLLLLLTLSLPISAPVLARSGGSMGGGFSRSSPTFSRPSYSPPSRPSAPSRPSYSAPSPSRPSYSPSKPAFQWPSQPSKPAFQYPSKPKFVFNEPPTRAIRYTAPVRLGWPSTPPRPNVFIHVDAGQRYVPSFYTPFYVEPLYSPPPVYASPAPVVMSDGDALSTLGYVLGTMLLIGLVWFFFFRRT